jgi:cobalt/nickel transport protein
MKRTNILLLLGVLVLVLIPLFTIKAHGDEEIFTGADGQAEGVIAASHADYQPWFQPFWEPPSGEIESLLFGLQAALGSGLICYCLGVYRGRKQVQTQEIPKS